MKDTQGIVTSEAACTTCHDGYAPDKRDSVWKRQIRTTLKNPPMSIRISGGLPFHHTEGGTDSGDRVTHRTCHEPYNWSKAFKHAAPSGEPADVPAVTDLEVGAASSFSRMPASPGAVLCIICHGDRALLIGTDHDCFVTAPSAASDLSRSVSETDICGACHALICSLEKHWLWAQGRGTADELPRKRR